MAREQLGVAPSIPAHTATKKYVDDAVAGVSGGSGTSNLKVQATNPGLAVPGLWIKTYVNGDLEFFVEDGT